MWPAVSYDDEYWDDMPEEVRRSSDPEYLIEELVKKKEEYRARVTELEEFIEEIDHQYEAMQQIKAWCDAYPVDVFTMPDWVEAKEKLGPELLSRVSAANMRHVVEGIKRIITECEKNNNE